jgi:hypothetical protein
MAGIRLHHPTLVAPAGGLLTYVVELELEWASRRSRFCKMCSRVHDRKAIHLKVDANGDTIVSAAVLERLRTVYLAGFEIVNDIAKPPTQYIGAVDQPTLLVVENKLNRDQTPEPAYVPPITKYESRDRLHRSLFTRLKEAFSG